MTNCTCGKAVRLRAIAISVNRRRGVSNWIEHMDGSAVCPSGDWTSAMLKPYPKIESERPSRQMIARWDALLLGDARGSGRDEKG